MLSDVRQLASNGLLRIEEDSGSEVGFVVTPEGLAFTAPETDPPVPPVGF